MYGADFLGKEELSSLLSRLGMELSRIEVPDIQYSEEILKQHADGYILILGIPGIDIAMLRAEFGINPDLSEPCFYNQDWYLQEDFIHRTLESRWYLLRKEVIEDTRAVRPDELLSEKLSFPSAILCAYTFFAYYLANRELLWYHDFVWCEDLDHNGDRIYIGKYHDIDGVNKNGFSIHRHLALRRCYASITCIHTDF